MTGADLDGQSQSTPTPRSRWRRKRLLALAAALGLLLLGFGVVWLSRERIAGNVIEGQLGQYGIDARYRIERIGGRRQVLRDLVVGNPAAPDLTADQVEVRIKYRLGTPQVGRITLVNPRVYGRLAGGRVRFGSLDRFLYRRTGKPPGLPPIDLAIRDGRALIRTPYGPIGVKLQGEGLVSDGFSGTVAAAAPVLALSGCSVGGASLFGSIATRAGEPRFAGPLRLSSLTCPGRDLAMERVGADLTISADKALGAFSGRAAIASGAVRYAEYRASGADLALRGGWKNGIINARHTVALREVTTPQAGAALVTIEGSLRAANRFARLDARSAVEGNGLRPGPGFARALDLLHRSGTGSFIQPLARRFADALARQARGSTFSGDLELRRNAGETSVMVPRAQMSGGGGARILSLSRVEARFRSNLPARFAGNIATGGPDLPEISGRMERAGTGGMVFRLAMQLYRAGDSSLAIPRMSVAQGPRGAFGFSGQAIAAGPLPGGATRGLSLPLVGSWLPGGAFSLWPGCIDVAFDQLQLANLTLGRRGLTLCPARGRAIVESGAHGFRIAAGAPSLDLAGSLGRTPIRLASGPVGFAYPGVMAARSVAIALGPPATASRFTVSNLQARLGGNDIAGLFAGADVRLHAVPLDLREAKGIWRYTHGVLELGEGEFRLVDRAADARFEPLVARGGTLRLKDNIVTGRATLRNPATDRVVTLVALAHDLRTATGHADLAVPGVLFDRTLQPQALSRRALGVIANARGTVTGTGRIDWGRGGITSSGEFSSDGLDFAAAFGPVKRARGTVRFSDLIGMTTAPGQTVQVASVNPGIEVTDGEFTFQLRGGKLLAVEGGSWPFMGGRLILKNVNLNFGAKEARRYVFEIEGLDAAAFVARFQLPNIAATGIFDGTVPVVFDANGNGRVEGGLLTARPPGGNVSYVGELTYKDLSPIANFAFDALRSLDYQRMTIGMSGSLTGEIVTNVNIEQVKQGAGARRNLITRALANLPIQFKINIRAPFYQLITSFKSLRDPAAVRDPRDLGLLSDDGTRLLKPEVRGEDVKPKIEPKDLIPGADLTKSPAPVQN